MDTTRPPQPKSRRGCWIALSALALIGLLCGGCLVGLTSLTKRLLVRHPGKGWVDSERRQLDPWTSPEGRSDVYAPALGLQDGEAGALDDLSPLLRADAEAITARRAEIDDVLARNREFLAAVREAPHEDYVAPERTPAAVDEIPDTIRLRGYARTAALAAAVAHVDGDDDRAFELLEDAFHVGATVRRGGALVDHLTGLAIIGLAERTDTEVILGGKASADRYLEHAGILREIRESMWPLADVLRAEADDLLRGYDAVLSGQGHEYWGADMPNIPGWAWTGVGAQQSREWVEDRMVRAIEHAEKPTREQNWGDFCRRVDADRDERGDHLAGVVSLVLRPKTGRQAIATQADLAALEIMAALEAYRTEQGEYPEELQDLTPDYLPDLPPDPWTGQPMVYNRDAAEPYLLYALGANREDDGGTPGQRDEWTADQRFVPPRSWDQSEDAAEPMTGMDPPTQ